MDDPSRILRGIRFAQRFGLRWERKTERAMREAVAAGALGWLNAGRLRKERELMAREPNPRACAQRLDALVQQGATGARA
jgi:tRNA nucleotidyltransferase (CCA-adding enzyme)